MNAGDRETAAEIHLILDDLARRDQPWLVTAVVESVLRLRRPGLSRHADRRRWLAWGHLAVADAVRRAIRVRTGNDSLGEGDDYLPGMAPGLRRYYTVKRAGERIALPLLEMTEAEIVEHIERLRHMGESCRAHAAALTEILDRRQRASA